MSDYDKRVIMGFGIPTRKSESDCADFRRWEIFLVAANNAFATENNVVSNAKGRKVFTSTVPLDLNKQNVFDWNVYFVVKKKTVES